MNKTIVQQVRDVEDDRTGLGVETLKRAILDNLFYLQGKSRRIATKNDWYMALAYTVRDRLVHRWITTRDTGTRKDVKLVCYMSAEFLTGPHLLNNMINMDILEPVSQAVEDLELDLAELIGLPLDSGYSGNRLRHPVRIWHFRPRDQGRLAGRNYGQVVALRQSLGDSPPGADYGC